MVLGADGSRDVLLPSPGSGHAKRFARRLPTCRRKTGRRCRSVHDPVQWSRRFIGLKLFLALAEHGESGYVEMIEHQAHMGDVLRESLKRAGWRIVNTDAAAGGVLHPRRAGRAAFLAALQKRQIAWMSEVRARRRTGLRACITSFRTTEAGYRVRGARNEPALYQEDTDAARETIAIHGGYEGRSDHKAVAVPIYQTVAYEFDSADHGAALFNLEAEGYRYSRISNPTTAVLERRVAALEGGLEALCVSTGQAALKYAVLNVTGLG